MNNNDNELIDFNQTEETIPKQPPVMNWDKVEVEEEPGFAKKHRFGIGFFSGLLTVIAVLVIVY